MEDKEVVEDVMDWTVVTRSVKQRRLQRHDAVSERKKTPRSVDRAIQVSVKTDGCKTLQLVVSPNDKVGDVVRRIPSSACCNKRDVYVTCEGRVSRRRDELKNFEIRDGSTMHVTSRLRGGGKQKDKKSEDEKKQAASTKKPEQKFEEETKNDEGRMDQKCDRDELVRMIEENKGYRRFVENMSKGSEIHMEQTMQGYLAKARLGMVWDQGQTGMLESAMWWAVEAKRKARDKERRQDRNVRFGEEEQPEETRAQSTDEREETNGVEEVRTRRKCARLVRRGDGVKRTRPAEKAKEKVTEARENMGAKEDSEAKERNSPRRCRGMKMTTIVSK